MLTNMDKLYESVAANGPVCVGLDTEISYLPTTDTAKTAGENVLDFKKIDKLSKKYDIFHKQKQEK